MRIQLLILLLALAAITAGGCQNKITGGTTLQTSEHTNTTLPDVETDRGSVVVLVDGRRVEVRTGDSITRTDGGATTTDRHLAATTQPSVQGDGKLTVDGVTASIRPIVEAFRNSWQLGILFFAAAGLVWWLFRRWLVALCLASLGVMAVLYPAALVWLAAAGVGLTIVANWKSFKEVVSGGQRLLEVTPPEKVEDVKGIMAEKQSSATKAAVKATK